MHLLLLLQLLALVLFLALVSHEEQVVAQFVFEPRFKSSVAPITKHDKTSLYSIIFDYKPIRYLIDLDAPVSWYDCVIKTPPYDCNAPACLLPVFVQSFPPVCKTARSYTYPSCPPLNKTRNGDVCTVHSVNPVTKSCTVSPLTYDMVHAYESDGRTPATSLNIAFYYFACASPTLLRSLPSNVSGVAALSSSPLALPSLLSPSYLGLRQIVSLCLPSSSSTPGVIFFGDGPYYLEPLTDIDIRSLLSYTPFVTNPKSAEYIISIHTILIHGEKPSSVKLGNSTVKLSTVVPYTMLKTSFYKHFMKRFSKATKEIPRAKAIKPFRLCYNTSAAGFSLSSFPRVDLQMKNGKNWSVDGSNSVKQVGDEVACLAYVDGGKKAKHGMVIGSFQMEDNFLSFDLENSLFGFSSSLSFANTSCGNFNFTMVRE